jgi:hypothetical protein
MLAQEKEHQNGNADKCKPPCGDVDAIDPSGRLLFVHRHRRESPRCAGYHAQDGQVANPVRVVRYLGDSQPRANENASKAGGPDQVSLAYCEPVPDRQAVGHGPPVAAVRLDQPGARLARQPVLQLCNLWRIAPAGITFGHSAVIPPLQPARIPVPCRSSVLTAALAYYLP